MVLQNRVAFSTRLKMQDAPESQDDSWLNDVGSASQSSSKNIFEDDTTIPLSRLKAKIPAPGRAGLPEHASTPAPSSMSRQASSQAPAREQQAAANPPSSEYIGIGHPLWPLVLRLSERIWRELYQKPDVTSASDLVLIEFVRKRAIDILRAEPALAQQVQGLAEAEHLLHSIVNEVLGYGPLEPLVKDGSIYEITAIGPRFTYVERNGNIEDVPCSFEDDRHMLRIVENMLRRAGRHMGPDCPIVDVRLPDGSLVNVVMPPYAVNGPTITIRKRSKKPFTMEDLVQVGSLSQDMAGFLRACVQARLNIVVCGGTASGRTTLLNALCAYIPLQERITTIEEAAELQLNQKHVVALVSQLAGTGASGGATMRDLVKNALRTRSDRIILGECQGEEVLEMIQAMYNGYKGALICMYANNLRDCMLRLETMCLAATMHMPVEMIRSQIASAVDVIVYVSRMRDNSRKVLNIVEVQGLEANAIKLQSMFYYRDAAPGQLKGEFVPSGFRSTKISPSPFPGSQDSPAGSPSSPGSRRL